MKKRGLIIGIFVIILVGVAFMATILTAKETQESNLKNDYETTNDLETRRIDKILISNRPYGTYNKEGFGSAYKMYEFDGTDLVMYGFFEHWFLFGDKSETNTGNSYYNVYLEESIWREPRLVAITPNYLIFSVKKYTNAPEEEREEIAVEIEETRGNFDDRLFHKSIKYNDVDLYNQCMRCNVVSILEFENAD